MIGTAVPSTAAQPTASRVQLGTLLTWVLVSLIGVYVVFVVGGFPGIYQVQWRLVTHILTLAVIVGWLAAIVWRPQWFVLPRLTLPITFVLGAMVVSTLASRYPRLGWETVVNAGATALVFGALVTMLAQPALRPRLRFTMAALVVGVVVAYAIELLWRWVEFWSLVGRLAVPPLRPAFAGLSFGTPNIPAGVVVVFLPLVLAWIHGSRLAPKARRAAIASLVVLGLFDLVVSGSRGAQFGFAVALIVGILLVGMDDERRARIRRWLAPTRHRVVAVTGAVAMGVATIIVSPFVLSRIGDAGVGLRTTFWRESLLALVDHPVTGTGPGTWAFAHWAYRDDVHPLDVVAHAHNIPIQLGSEIGLIGLACGAVFLAGVIGLLAAAWRRSTRAEVIAIAAGLSALLAQNLVDNFSDLPLYVAGVAFLLAWLESDLVRAAIISHVVVRVAAAVMFSVVLVVGGLFVLPWDRAAQAYLDGVSAQNQSEWQAAVTAYSAAVDLDPDYPQYRGAHGVAADWAGDGAVAAEQLTIGSRLAGDPFMAAQAALATIASGGPSAAAAALLAEATDRGTVNVDLALNAGAVAERLGRPEDAARFYATAMALQPSIAGSAYWRDPARPLTPEAQAEAAIARLAELETDVDPPTAAIAIWTGIGAWDRAMAATERLPTADERDAFRAWIEAMHGDRDGLETLRAMSGSSAGYSVPLLASAANHLGDPQAEQYRAWTAIVSSGSDRAGRRTVLAQGGGEEATYLDLGPATAEEVYLRDRGIVTQVREALQMAYR